MRGRVQRAKEGHFILPTGVFKSFGDLEGDGRAERVAQDGVRSVGLVQLDVLDVAVCNVGNAGEVDGILQPGIESPSAETV